MRKFAAAQVLAGHLLILLMAAAPPSPAGAPGSGRTIGGWSSLPAAGSTSARQIAETAMLKPRAGGFMICVTRYRIGRNGGSLGFCPAGNRPDGAKCSCRGAPSAGIAVELHTGRLKPEPGARSYNLVDPGAQSDFLKRLRECCR